MGRGLPPRRGRDSPGGMPAEKKVLVPVEKNGAASKAPPFQASSVRCRQFPAARILLLGPFILMAAANSIQKIR